MKKRALISVVAGGLMAAVLPGVAVAQMEGEGTTTYIANLTCEAGQESPLMLPPCEFDEEAGLLTFTMLNPATTTGALEGMQVLDGVGVQNVADGSFTGSGLLFWVGTVEGCGAGTFNAEAEFAGVGDADGVNTFSVNNFTIVPGGSLPITGTWDGTGTEVLNADGSRSQATTFTYSCDEVAAAEGDADADVEDTADDAEEQAEDKADDAEEQAEDKADDAEEKADEKEQELEEKADEKEEELRDDG